MVNSNLVIPGIQSQEAITFIWEFYVIDLLVLSSTHCMINDERIVLLGYQGMIIKFNYHTDTWEVDIMQINDRDTCVFSSLEAFIEVYLIVNHT
jgi:hypothetical protein